jgi:Tol biopolymer transport system component
MSCDKEADMVRLRNLARRASRREYRAATLAVAVLLVALAAAARIATRGSSPASEVENGRIVFRSDHVGDSESFAIDAASGTVWMLTSGTATGDISPDGEHRVKAFADPSDVEDPDWARDGSRLAYRCGGFSFLLCVSDEKHHATPITSPAEEGGDQYPRWSPRGDLIAFDRGYSALYVVRPDGSKLHHLAESISPGSFSWSPNGDALVYIAELPDYAHEHVYVVDVNGSEPRRLWNGLASGYGNPRWSPDGTTVAVAPKAGGVVAVHVVSGRATDLVPREQDVRELAWSPRGDQLAYTVAHYPENPALWAVDVHSGLRRLLLSGADFGGDIDSLSWQARGSRLAQAQRGSVDSVRDLFLVSPAPRGATGWSPSRVKRGRSTLASHACRTTAPSTRS